jgi:hypothetical protein
VNTLLGILLESSLRACLPAAIVALALTAARVRPAAVAHAAWTSVLGAMLLMPVLPRLIPLQFVPSLPVGMAVQVRFVATSAITAPASVPLPVSVPPVIPQAAPAVTAESPVESRPVWPLLLVCLYLAGLLLSLTWLLLGWHSARGMMRASAALRYMLSASFAPRTDVLAYTIQGLTFQLPAWLLKDGERDSVIEFLERFAQVDIGERRDLLAGAAAIRQGKKPMWYHD